MSLDCNIDDVKSHQAASEAAGAHCSLCAAFRQFFKLPLEDISQILHTVFKTFIKTFYLKDP